MKLFLISFLVIALAALAMALGLIAGRRPIKAGCGSILSLEGTESGCEICGGTCESGQGARSAEPIRPLGGGRPIA